MAGLTEQQRARFAKALQRMDGDEEVFSAMAAMAVEDAPPMLAELECQVDGGDLEEVARTGHALKGMLAVYDDGPPVSELQPLIDAARRGDGKAVQGLFTPLQRPLISLIEEVRQLALMG